MEVSIKVTNGAYGFGKNWALYCRTAKKERLFYLGQDIKVCNRLLVMSPREVVNTIGTAEIDEGTRGNIKLAKLIAKEVGVTGHNLNKFENWAFSVE